MAADTGRDASMPRMVGRFVVRGALGRGAQGTVYLAFDPRLEREVAIKQVRAQGGDAQAVQRWLAEARVVSRLNHPNIVLLFEADVADDHPFLVFEAVRGQTLGELIRQRGAMTDRVAVELMLGVLDGLAHAHAAGVVHRDLKPSNVMVDESGRARVMDFGLAWVDRDARGESALVGTCGYMAPELIRGQAPTAAVDVFAAGLLLYEMIMGRPAVSETDPYRAMFRLSNEDVELPEDTPTPVDPALRTVLRRALSRDPLERHPDAGTLRHALAGWLNPPVNPGQSEGEASGTLEFLLRRMRHKADFPTLSDSIGRIQRITQSENESVASLSNEILKDVALTNKLLRLVNSTYYASAGSGTISTVSRAVALVGFAGIRNLALSLVLMDHMSDKHNAAALREEFLRAIMAGTLAHDLCESAREAEETFIAGMFQNLGRMLTQFYFPEEAEQIRRLLARPGAAAPGWAEEQAAARSVLGVDFVQLGQSVARHWGLPESLTRAMNRVIPDASGKISVQGDRVQLFASVANQMADSLMGCPPQHMAARLDDLAERHSRSLGIKPRQVAQAVTSVQQRMRELTQALSLQIRPGSAVAALLGDPLRTDDSATGSAEAGADSLGAHALDAAAARATTAMQTPVGEQQRQALGDSVKAAERLAAGIQDITNSLVEETVSLQQLLRMVLETMVQALGFQRVVLCLRDPRTGILIGRLALGAQGEAVAPRFQIRPGSPNDLFAAVCTRGADLLISDASVPSIASRLPDWYVRAAHAPTFLLLPMVVKGSPVGLIYADRARAGDIVISERELSLLRTLRNQAVMALRQASKGSA